MPFDEKVLSQDEATGLCVVDKWATEAALAHEHEKKESQGLINGHKVERVSGLSKSPKRWLALVILVVCFLIMFIKFPGGTSVDSAWRDKVPKKPQDQLDDDDYLKEDTRQDYHGTEKNFGTTEDSSAVDLYGSSAVDSYEMDEQVKDKQLEDKQLEDKQLDDKQKEIEQERSSGFASHELNFERPRVILIAGPLGSGQQVWRDYFTNICVKEKAVKCKRLCAVSSNLLHISDTVEEFNFAQRAALEELNSLERDTLYIGNLFDSDSCNQMDNSLTFPPEHLSPANSSVHPDLLNLSDLADQANVDMRFIIPLHREILVHFHGFIDASKGKTAPYFRILQALEIQFTSLYSIVSGLRSDRFRLFDLSSATMPNTSFDEWVGVKGSEAWLAGMQDHFKPPVSNWLKNYTKEFLQDSELILDRLWGISDESHLLPIIDKSPSSPGNRPLLVFFAGLEGTAHHLWHDIVLNLMGKKVVKKACAINHFAYNNDTEFSMFHTNTLERYHTARENVANAMEKLPRKSDMLNAINLINPHCHSRAGMMSLPNFGGAWKNNQKVNLMTLARLAEEADIDFKVVLLMRNTEAIIKSTVDHRRMTTEVREARILTSNAQGMFSQLQALHPKFVAGCASFEDRTKKFLPGLDEELNLHGNLIRAYNAKMKPSKTFSGRKKASNADLAQKVEDRRKDFLKKLDRTQARIRQIYCSL